MATFAHPGCVNLADTPVPPLPRPGMGYLDVPGTRVPRYVYRALPTPRSIINAIREGMNLYGITESEIIETTGLSEEVIENAMCHGYGRPGDVVAILNAVNVIPVTLPHPSVLLRGL